MTTMKAFITRHPVRTNFALTFAISWGGVLPTTEEEQGLRHVEIIPAHGNYSAPLRGQLWAARRRAPRIW